MFLLKLISLCLPLNDYFCSSFLGIIFVLKLSSWVRAVFVMLKRTLGLWEPFLGLGWHLRTVGVPVSLCYCVSNTDFWTNPRGLFLMLWTGSRNVVLVREVQEAVGFTFPQPPWPLVSLGVLTESEPSWQTRKVRKREVHGQGARPLTCLVRENSVLSVWLAGHT